MMMSAALGSDTIFGLLLVLSGSGHRKIRRVKSTNTVKHVTFALMCSHCTTVRTSRFKGLSKMYRADGVDGPQEMEIN